MAATAVYSALPAPKGREEAEVLVPFDEGWAVLKIGLDKLLRVVQGGYAVSFPNSEYIQLYTHVYNMCTQKGEMNWTTRLYSTVQEYLRAYLRDTVLPAVSAAADKYLLLELTRRWEQHIVMRRWLSKLFNYLDRFYVRRLALPTLAAVADSHFHDIVFDAVKAPVLSAFLALQSAARDGESVEAYLLHNVSAIYVAMGHGSMSVYESELESAAVSSTADYCARLAARWLAECSCDGYLAAADAWMRAEDARLRKQLHSSSYDKMMAVIDEQLLSAVHKRVLSLGTGLRPLLLQARHLDLARLFRLFSRVPSTLPHIARLVEEMITADGTAMLDGMADDGGKPTVASAGRRKRGGGHGRRRRAAAAAGGSGSGSGADGRLTTSGFVAAMMDFNDKYKHIVELCFQEHPAFHKALKTACEACMNRDVPGARSIPELLCDFCDRLMKKGGPKDSELEHAVDRVLRLFMYLLEKDKFAAFYKRQLAKRLLLGKSASHDAEHMLLRKLRVLVGGQFTSKLEGMARDMAQGKELQSAFATWASEGGKALPLELSLNLLTQGFWPSYKSDELTLASELASVVSTFADFYAERTSSRVMRWIHSLGVVTLSMAMPAPAAGAPPRRLDIAANTHQACVLLLFNHYDNVDLATVARLLHVSIDDARKYVTPMVTGKYKLLISDSETPALHKLDILELNPDFTTSSRRIKIPMLVSKAASDADRAKSMAAVDEDRKHAMEACIVRTMKTRRTMAHSALLAEVTTQLSTYFQPDPRLLKRRIEDLISREYLERDDADHNLYHYCA